MTRFVIVLITAAAAPFVFWLFKRRTATRGGTEGVEPGRQATDRPHTAEAETGNSTDHRPAITLKETPEKHEGALPETAEKTASGAAYAEAPAMPDAMAEREVESNQCRDDFGVDLVRDREAESEPQPSAPGLDEVSLPRSSSQIAPEEETHIGGLGIPDISSGGPSSEMPLALAPAALAIRANNQHSEHELPQMGVVQTVAGTLVNELPDQSSTDEEEQPCQPFEEADADDADGAIPRYHPPSQRPPRKASARPTSHRGESETRRDVELDIRVALRLDRSEFCSIGFLPARTPELDDEVIARYKGGSLRLCAEEDWYEELPLESFSNGLRSGVELRARLADGRSARWLLSGRDLYVLAQHPKASCFVSTSRLALGRSHIVLCVAEIRQQVEEILRAGGCEGYTKLDESNGMAAGWIGLRGVLPATALPLETGADPFYAIKPAAEINIELEGGVWLRNAAWLAGYPPQIKLFGELNGAKVLIDGKQSRKTGEGLFIADGYDTVGQHTIYCEGLSRSRSYSIEEPPDSWEEWPAYKSGDAEICGPIVELRPGIAARPAFTVPMSNPVLLGAEPGQVFWCPPRRVSRWKGYVPFDVVWALPAQPLLCNKKSARILQFGATPIVRSKAERRPVLSWCNAILDASRKGLRIENGSSDADALWNEYKKAARSIRRGRQ